MANRTDIPAVNLRRWYLDEEDEETFRELTRRGDHRFTDGFLPESYTEGMEYRWIKDMVDNMLFGGELHYAVEVDGRSVGCLNVSRCGGVYRHTGLLRLILLPEYCGKGIGTQAVAQTIGNIRGKYFDSTFVFEGSFERLEAQVIGDNKAAKRLLEKNDFTYEGTLRNAICKHNVRYDMSIYGYVFRSHCPSDRDSMPEDKNERVRMLQEILKEA